MDRNVTVVTERGQISIPAAVRRELDLKAGECLRWEKSSGRECRVRVVEREQQKGAEEMLGFASRFRGERGRSTKAWMRELRESED